MRVRKAKEKLFRHSFCEIKSGWKSWILVNITFVLGEMKKEGLYIDDNAYSTS